jgi:hypothetical protein
VYTGVRKVNCHTKGCWRIGDHPLEALRISCADTTTRTYRPEVPRMTTSSSSIENSRKLARLDKPKRSYGA